MENHIKNLLEKAATNTEFRKELLENPSHVVTEEGYRLSSDEQEFLESLPELIAEGVVASFGNSSSQPIAQGGISPAQASFAAAQGQQAASQAVAAGLSPAAQQFAAHTATSSWVSAAQQQAAARQNIQSAPKLQFAAEKNQVPE